MYTAEDVYRIVSEFRDLANECEILMRVADEDINEADKAFGDIRHYCELNYPVERHDKTRVCQLIKQYSDQRRRAKNFKEVLTPLSEFIKLKDVSRGIGTMANSTRKKHDFINSDRRYEPRILNELFKGE